MDTLNYVNMYMHDVHTPIPCIFHLECMCVCCLTGQLLNRHSTYKLATCSHIDDAVTIIIGSKYSVRYDHRSTMAVVDKTCVANCLHADVHERQGPYDGFTYGTFMFTSSDCIIAKLLYLMVL